MKNSKKRQRCLWGLFPKFLFVALFALVSLTAMAQNKSISGIVVDQLGEPIIGASIIVEGTTNGTITDFDGNFTIQDVPENAQLKVSYIGYITQSLAVKGTSSFRITLDEDMQLLNEVVVVGYGVQKKSDLTGAVVSVGAKEIEARPVTNALQAMQGRMAGVDITSSERPGELGQVRIRGVRSVNATNEPLYVVDGMPIMGTNAMVSINPRDIESIDVLKDASATAIYGSRGANGVIIVTTKKGKNGNFRVNYSGTVTIENLQDKSKMMSASEYITWRRWAYYNQGLISAPGDQPTMEGDMTAFSLVSGGDQTAWENIMRGWASGTWDGSQVINTDWTEFAKQTGVTHEHTISASGGTDKMQSYFSFGYLNNEGTILGQANERYTTKMSTDITPVKWFSLGGTINASWSNQDYGFTNGSYSSNLYEAAKGIYNYALPYDADGNVIQVPGGDTSVNTIINEWDYYVTQRQTLRALGSFYAQLDLGEMHPVLKGLRYRFNIGPDYRHFRSGQYIDKNSVTRLGAGTSYANLSNTREFSWTLDNLITYNNSFGKHNVGITLLQTASKYDKETSSMSAVGIERPERLWNAFNKGTIDITNPDYKVDINSDLMNEQLSSYMIRLNYGFNDRYLLTTSGRWDGASQLAEGHKWSFFPSFALAWRMEQESFIQKIKWVDQMKLRLGIGTVGNAAVKAYDTLGKIQAIQLPFETNQIAYTTNEPNYGGGLIKANKTLGWEMTTQYNLALDFSVLKGRISGTLEGYISKTDDLLFLMSIPTLTGYSQTWANIGKTKNKGLDFTLNTVNLKNKNFEWITNTTFSYVKDEVVDLANGKQDDISNGLFIGEPIWVFYNYDNDGIWSDSEEDLAEIAEFNKNGHNFRPGMVKPIDQNGDNKIDPNDDRVVLGNQRPLFTMGMSNTFTYKNIELAFMMFGRFKYMINTGGELQTGRANQRSIDYWTPTNQNAEYQMPIASTSGGDTYSALLGYKKANFLKMRNISLGYVFPQKITSKAGLSNLKIYAQVTNPFTIYSSVDFRDLDLNTSYYNRGFVFGLDISF